MSHHRLSERGVMTPVLMYHDILASGTPLHKYTVLLNKFSEQMAFVKGNAIRTLSMKDFFDSFYMGGSTLVHPADSIILTFDDGHISNYSHALPMLIEMGFAATFFITTGYTGKKKDFLTRTQIRVMSESGMTIGSHTDSHRFLDELSSKDIYNELYQSKSFLEDVTGKEVAFLSCPGGRYSPEVIDVAADTGYCGIFTSVPTSTVLGGRILVGGRFLIDSTIKINTFKQIVNLKSTYIVKKRIDYALKAFLKKTIGNKVYYSIWHRLSTSSKS